MKTIGLKNRQSGFTLIEIIIVVVILGILAAVALPKMTTNIDKARAAEAFSVMSTISGAFHRCIDEQTGGIRVPVAADVTACDSFAELSITDPSGVSNNFNYTMVGAALVNTVTATGKFAGFGATDTILLAMTATTGANVKTCTAGGRFVTMCKN